MYRKTYVEVNLDNLNKNVRNIVSSFPGYKYYIGVVKGNAYGHGEYISKHIIQNGVNYLAVSSLEEAINVRKYVDKDFPILCLEPISIEFIEDVIKYNVTITVANLDYFKKLSKLKLSSLVKFHLKLNTGMNRLGISSLEDVKYIFNYKNSNLKFEGIYSHLATNGVYDSLFDRQVEKFKYLTSEIDLSKIEIVHFGKSATLDFFPKFDFCNGVRLGIMMYGVGSTFPSRNGIRSKLSILKYKYIRKKYNLSTPYEESKFSPIQSLSLKSEVVDVHKIGKGESVGYGFSSIIDRDAYIAVLPIGYADGLQLKYSDWKVDINGKKYPVMGSINMGMITVVVDDSVRVGDMATLIDDTDDYKVMARKFGVSPYVLITNLHRELPRVYKCDNEIIEIVEGD